MITVESIFVRIVETGSFKKAAEQLNMEASTISRRITKLEQRLNAKLLNRSTSKTTPTEVGLSYYAGLRKLIDEQQALEEEIFSNSEKVQGLLRIATTVDLGDYVITPIIQQMLSLAPKLNIQLILGAEINDLLATNIDVAIRIGTLESTDLYAKYLGEIPRLLVASPSYLKTHGIPQHPKELAQHKFVLYSELQSKLDIQFQDGSTLSHTKMQSSVMVNSLNSIRYLVKKDNGIHWGPRWLYEKDLKCGELVEVLPSFPAKGLTLNALYTTKKYLPYRVRWFLELLTKNINLTAISDKHQ